MRDITIIRRKYYTQTTIGELYIDDRLFCYTLEDTVRPHNIKVKEFTAIPPGRYFVTIRHSPYFKRDMVMLYNNETKEKVTNEIISFSYVYLHGGNKHKDTSGCILVGFNKNKNTIYSTAELALFNIIKEWLDNKEEVIITIVNSSQTM